MEYIITKWCKIVTDSKNDEYVNKGKVKKNMIHKFRILDDDDVVYAYGVASEIDFDLLDHYGPLYGCTSIQYKNKETGKYEYL